MGAELACIWGSATSPVAREAKFEDFQFWEFSCIYVFMPTRFNAE